MRVRQPEAPEVDRLAVIWHQGWHEAHAHLVPANLVRIRTLDSFRERLREGLPATRVTGPVGGPSGFCMIKDDELYQLFVAAEARGTGAAAALVADAEERLAAAGLRVGNAINPLETPEGILDLEVWRYEKRLRP